MKEWNKVKLSGKVMEIEKISQLCGYPFHGYRAKLEIARLSDTQDEVLVVFDIGAVKHPSKGGNILGMFPIGSYMYVEGAMQTIKSFETGKVLVYTRGHDVDTGNSIHMNSVDICGRIAWAPDYRVTPKGVHITDLILQVRNEMTGGKCYIPCICWNIFADMAANWNAGDMIKAKARIQSRPYRKLINEATGEREWRTAYELSIWKVFQMIETSETLTHAG